ncbi:hypothetical protein AB0C02_30550 [Micromonospora sp. NPDC048999]|uniref:hypothetical protein n=1 Tax=Micromonospora sp. NPDC048999 TaxID=3155391 RepID=UPI0033F100D7
MTASPARRAVAAPRTLPLSMLSALRGRLAGAGWACRRDAQLGREEWTEPVQPAGPREPRAVRVDEMPGEPGVRVVEGSNGRERLVIRCVPDTDPAIVLVTLDVWRILPDPGAVSTGA